MSSDTTEQQHRKHVHQILSAEVLAKAEQPDNPELQIPAFVDFVLDGLTESGAWPQHELAHYRHRTNGELEAWGIDDGFSTLHVAVADWNPEKTAKPFQREVAAKKISNCLKFLKACINEDLADRLEEASDAAAAARSIRAGAGRDFSSVHILLLSNHYADEEPFQPADESDLDLDVRTEVWDLIRLGSEIGLGKPPPPIEINFETQFGAALPCLTTHTSGEAIAVHSAFVPGRVLGRISHDYGTRLLESNVRTYLNAAGKVNKGILETIANEPGRFIAYNNGITCTADSVELTEDGRGIRRVVGFQVVNGGQTTASLGRAFHEDDADPDSNNRLENITVQMKLVEAPSGIADELVPRISLYANRQNAVNEADLSAHHPFHIALFRHASDLPVPTEQRPTYWYYERLRGSYQMMLVDAETKAVRKQLRERFHKSRKLTKTDLAKYHSTWAQRPWIVALGAQKCHKDFMARVDAAADGLTADPEPDLFKDLIGKAILYKRTETIYKALELGTHRAETVAYTIALLSKKLHGTLNWDSVWETQALEPALENVVADLLPTIREFLVVSAEDRLVREWAKKEEAWTALLEAGIQPDLTGVTGTTPLDYRTPKSASGLEELTAEQEAALRWIATLPPTYFSSLLEYALDHPEFRFNERNFLAQTAGLAGAGDQKMTPRQAAWYSRIKDKALSLGWRP